MRQAHRTPVLREVLFYLGMKHEITVLSFRIIRQADDNGKLCHFKNVQSRVAICSPPKKKPNCPRYSMNVTNTWSSPNSVHFEILTIDFRCHNIIIFFPLLSDPSCFYEFSPHFYLLFLGPSFDQYTLPFLICCTYRPNNNTKWTV